MPAFRADRAQVEQVLLNLILNAAEAMPKGGLLRLSATLEKIDDEPCIALAIRDNGMGMSAERLLEVYGGGIGISNVHERLRLLYGDQFEMNIRSQEGEGTQIRIEIPELATVETAV